MKVKRVVEIDPVHASRVLHILQEEGVAPEVINAASCAAEGFIREHLIKFMYEYSYEKPVTKTHIMCLIALIAAGTNDIGESLANQKEESVQ